MLVYMVTKTYHEFQGGQPEQVGGRVMHDNLGGWKSVEAFRQYYAGRAEELPGGRAFKFPLSTYYDDLVAYQIVWFCTEAEQRRFLDYYEWAEEQKWRIVSDSPFPVSE